MVTCGASADVPIRQEAAAGWRHHRRWQGTFATCRAPGVRISQIPCRCRGRTACPRGMLPSSCLEHIRRSRIFALTHSLRESGGSEKCRKSKNGPGNRARKNAPGSKASGVRKIGSRRAFPGNGFNHGASGCGGPSCYRQKALRQEKPSNCVLSGGAKEGAGGEAGLSPRKSWREISIPAPSAVMSSP